MQCANVALVWALVLTSVSQAAPLPGQANSREHGDRISAYEGPWLQRRLIPWLYTTKVNRKQLGSSIGSSLTMSGAALAMSGWYLNESSKDMNDRMADMNHKVSAAKRKRLEREVAEMWEHHAQASHPELPRKSAEPRHSNKSELDRRGPWGGAQTENILKYIEDYAKAGAGTLSLTAGAAVLINAAYDNQETRKKLARARASFDERLSRAEAKETRPAVRTTSLQPSSTPSPLPLDSTSRVPPQTMGGLPPSLGQVTPPHSYL